MIEQAKQKLKILAVADAILLPEWEDRSFSYNAEWGDGSEMASFRDGCGAEWFVWIKGDQIAFKSYSPDDGEMKDISEVKKKFPKSFAPFLNEPAFSMDYATALGYFDSTWHLFGSELSGIVSPLEVLSWDAETYQTLATDQYEIDTPLETLEKLFSGSISEEIALQLNPTIDLENFHEDLKEIGL